MNWGAGSELGLLTILGDLFFLAGAILFWRDRNRVFLWMEDEFGIFRRSLSRYTVVGPFYGPREESRLRIIPSFFVRTLRRAPRSRVNRAAILLFLGGLFVFLDFFV
jgi:hypothetical protein